MHFTVAIPTYNGAKKIPLVLDLLRSQKGVDNLCWEIIVIDNKSSDNTKEVVKNYQQKYSSNLSLKYSFESQQGAAFARKKAIEISTSPFVGFLDDDNLPESTWVQSAYAFAKKHPKFGACASQIHGDFEGALPPNFDRIKAFFAITESGQKPFQYTIQKRVMPPSAGLVIRKEAWQKSVPEKTILSGRVPGSMLTSEDMETIAHIQKAGWEVWYNPAMEITHKISKDRLEKDYMLRFFKGIGLSRYVTRMIHIKPWLRPLALLGYSANDVRKIIYQLIKYGPQIKTDIVAACELKLYISSLQSFFYLWRNGYFK